MRSQATTYRKSIDHLGVELERAGGPHNAQADRGEESIRLVWDLLQRNGDKTHEDATTQIQRLVPLHGQPRVEKAESQQTSVNGNAQRKRDLSVLTSSVGRGWE